MILKMIFYAIISVSSFVFLCYAINSMGDMSEYSFITLCCYLIAIFCSVIIMGINLIKVAMIIEEKYGW